jgi:hypothetical protein
LRYLVMGVVGGPEIRRRTGHVEVHKGSILPEDRR